MKSLLLLKKVVVLMFFTSLFTYAQLQPVQNIPLDGSTVYGSSTYIAWYFNGYEAGITVELQVSTNSNMSSPFVDVTGLTGLTYNVTGLTNGTTYYWRIRSKSSGGAYSSWSNVWSFTAGSYGGGTATPLVPQLNIPLNGSTVTSTSTTLAWYLNGSSVGLTYHVQVATSSGFSSFFVNDSGLTDLTYALSGLTDGNTYYWRVRSKNGAGIKSAWSSTYSFDVNTTGGGGVATPLVPQLNIPLNGSTVASSSATLAWYLNGSSAGLTYHLQVSTSGSFGSFFVNDSGLTSFSYNLTGLTDGNTYYWRVRSKNAADSVSAWSTTFSFNVNLGGGGGVPSPPTHYFPPDDTTNFSYHPTLIWNSVSGAFSYSLQVSTDSTFASVDRYYTGLTDTSKHIHYPKATEYLELDTEYFWRVNVTTIGGTSAWSSPWSFTTKDTPDTPTQISPADDSTLAYTNVELLWSDVIKADSYRVEIYDDTTVAAFDSYTGADTSYMFNGDPSTQYWWKVRATANLNSSLYSGFWSFTTGTNTVWYVETAANGGDDNNDGFHPDSPFETIQFAINSSSEGDKIIVGPGTYNESLDVSVGVELTSAEGADSTVINGQTATAITISSDNVVVNGFTITNPSGQRGIYAVDYNNISIINNIFDDIGSSENSGSSPGHNSNNAIAIVSNTSPVDSISISNNVINNIYGGINSKSVTGIALGWSSGNEIISNVLIQNNVISNIIPSSGTPWGTYGILVNHSTTGLQILNNDIKDITGGEWVHGIGLEGDTPSALVKDNDFSNLTSLKPNDKYAVFFEANKSMGSVSFNYNNVNTTHGLGIHQELLDTLSVADSTIDAENNWWGDPTGPAGAGLSGSGALFGTNDSLKSIVAYVDYIPWLGGTPTLDIDDDSAPTGATVTLDVSTNLFGESFNYTLSGRFVYDNSKLDFTTGTVGSGTVLNNAGWSAVFYETTPGVIDFIAYGFSPVSGSGNLFSLSFTIIATSSGSASVTGSYSDFLADGTNLFGTSGTFGGTVTYTHTGSVSTLKGDADLDGNVDYDDITVMAQHVAGSDTLTGQAFTNANVDSDSDVDANDISATINYIINGTWSISPNVVASSSGVSFEAVSEDNVGQIYLPFSVSDASTDKKVTSVEFIIIYDEEELDYQSFKGSVEGEGVFVNASKVDDGIAKFVFASGEGIDKSSEIGKFILKKNVINPVSEITSVYRVNDGDPQEGPTFKMDAITDVEEEELPSEYDLTQNYPNPFNPTTTINYAIPEASYVTVKIYNMLGQEVKTLVAEEMTAGKYNIAWNGRNEAGQKVSSGTYIYRIVAGDFVQAKKMILLK